MASDATGSSLWRAWLKEMDTKSLGLVESITPSKPNLPTKVSLVPLNELGVDQNIPDASHDAQTRS